MADLKLPRQIALVADQFPKEGWATSLVGLLNQFALEVVQAFRFAQPKYRALVFTTGATVADSFPIDFPVESTPVDVWVASSGDTGTDAVTVKWQPIVTQGLSVRVSFITGLSPDTAYSIRLGCR